MGAEISPYACQTASVRAIGERGAATRSALKQLLQRLLELSCQQIMEPRFENYERTRRDERKAATDATYLRRPARCDCIIRREIRHFDVYIREVLVSVRNVIPFTRPSRRGLTPQKTYNDFFFLKREQNKQEKKSRKASSLIFCPFPTSLLVYFLVEILLECKVNRLRYSEGLGLARRCQISRWAQPVDSSDTAMAAVQERGSARRFKVAGWLLFMNKTVACNLGRRTNTHTHTITRKQEAGSTERTRWWWLKHNESVYFFRLINSKGLEKMS